MTAKSEARQKRQALALRENLKRRKALDRARQSGSGLVEPVETAPSAREMQAKEGASRSPARLSP